MKTHSAKLLLLAAAFLVVAVSDVKAQWSGSFSYTGSLTDERDSGARAVLLDSGADLVTGGEWNYRVYRTHFWNTAEIYQ
jgi:hypothetical protein